MCAMAEHYCSRHKKHLPIKDFSVNENHIPDRCNACLESDRVRCEAKRADAITSTLGSSTTFNAICSELSTQKEKEHLTHSISFNSEKLFDFQLAFPGDNAAQLDPATETGREQFKSHADGLAERLWHLLGYRWQ